MIIFYVCMANKKHCYDFIKNLLGHLEQDEIDNVKKMLEKFEANKDEANKFIGRYTQNKAKILQDKIYDQVNNFQKTQLAIDAIDKVKQMNYKADIITGEKKQRSFAEAFRDFVYSPHSSNLINEKRVNKNLTLISLYQKLEAIDKEATDLAFGHKTSQMWEGLKFWGGKTENQIASQKLSDDIAMELYHLNLSDKSNARIGITNNKTAIQFAKVIREELNPLLEHLKIDKLDGHAGVQGHDIDKLKKLTPRQFADMLIDDYGLDIGRMYKGELKRNSLKTKDGKFASAVVITEDGMENIITRQKLSENLFWSHENIINGGIKESLYNKTDIRGVKRRFIHFKDIETQLR